MKTRPSLRSTAPGEAGFSMLEFLMAAFILAIGLLGLASLQIMALKTTTTSRGMSTAILVSEGVMERINSEARQSYLGMVFNGAPTWTPRYITKAPVVAGVLPTAAPPANAIVDYFDFAGDPLPNAVGAYYTSSSWVDTQTVGVGTADRYFVRVEFSESPDPANPGKLVKRSVNLIRSVVHA
ncbi:MAG TPA: hypothetical protein VJ463_04680 [Geothrix sp.]|nr:hypothetical protein [Geothrix sp.]